MESTNPAEEANGSKLRGEVQLLKEQLASAYEKAAEATSRIAQYQALAESSNQALEAMQVKRCQWNLQSKETLFPGWNFCHGGCLKHVASQMELRCLHLKLIAVQSCS